MPTTRDPKQQKRLETFRQVATGRLNRLNLGWIEQEKGGTDPKPFMRELHTFKGECSLMGFPAASKILHAVEDILKRLQDGRISASQGHGDLVLRGFSLVDQLARRDPEDPTPELDGFLADVAALLKAAESPDANPAGGGAPAPAPTPTAAPMQATPVGAAAQPPAAPASAQSPPPASAQAPTTPAPPSTVPTPAAASTTEDERRRDTVVAVDSAKLDRMRAMVEDLLLTRVRLDATAAELRRTKEGTLQLQRSAFRLDKELGHQCELLGQVMAGVEARLREEAHAVNRLVSELDGTTRDLRMIPLRTLLEKYPLPIRALARTLGKQVSLSIEGQDVEVDKAVLDVLEEPLLHLLRNAVDHGVESPQVRAAAGKAAEATIRIRAHLVGHILHLDVMDDGFGIDVETVRQRGIELGLLDRATAAGLPDERVLRTIFSAGFSTRRQVTEVSGRGIGLNVVLDGVQSLGGTVEVDTERGKGTQFHVCVPINVAITRALMFTVGAGRYALLGSAVSDLVDPGDAVMVDSVDGPALRHHDLVIPVLSLESLLEEGGAESHGRIIIVQSGGDLLALRGSYDHLEREVVLKPLPRFFEKQSLVSAAVHLEDGTLALVLKASELALRCRAGRRGAAPEGSDRRVARTVLVVDDSPVVRDLIASALRAHGLFVLEAGDGIEALATLEANDRVGLLLTDVDMPRMNGLELVRTLRTRDTLSRLPAVVISMRGSDADKQLAIQAGADAYLVKSDFSQAGLWNMISRYLRT